MNNKFQQFLAKYNGQFVEAVDPTNWAQCFDLAVKWCEELGLPTNIFSGLMYAYQIWNPSTTIAVKNFDFIDNTPDAIPQVGDMVVWSNKYGSAGHVGMACEGATVDTFDCFEQNDPFGSNSHVKRYNYTSVLGWLRYKFPPTTPQTPSENWQLKYEEKVKLETELRNAVSQKDTLIKALNQQIVEKNATIADVEKENDMLSDKLELCEQANQMGSECTKSLLEARQSLKLLESQKENWGEKEQNYIKQVKTLTTRLETIRTTLVPKKYLSLKIYNALMKWEEVKHEK